jgi:hypothetical protein
MITDDHIEQIVRLGLEYFGDKEVRFYHWLRANFKVDQVHQLASIERAGQIIHVLKEMITRKESS